MKHPLIAKLFQQVLHTSRLSNYFVDIKESKEKNACFSVSVNYPYRKITLYVHPEGKELEKKKKTKDLKRLLFHEAFHVFIWEYYELAQERFINQNQLKDKEEDLADKFSLILTDLTK